jgi:hypothetical protein
LAFPVCDLRQHRDDQLPNAATDWAETKPPDRQGFRAPI